MEYFPNTAYYMLHLPIRLQHWHLCRRHDLRDHYAAASISRPLMRQLSDKSSVIGIGSFALVAISDLIQLTTPGLTWLSFPD